MKLVSERDVQWMAIGRLIPYSNNPRQNDHATEKMCGAIRDFGFKIPILARSTGEVIDGHLRLKAAQRLKLTEVPIIVCDEWTEAEVRAFRILVNKSSEWADWDEEALRRELEDLRVAGMDLERTGFDVDELQALLSPPTTGLTSEDAVVLPSQTPVSRRGDRWILGPHRLACGDATDRDDVEALLAGTVPRLMVTDPPYGVNYHPEWRNTAARSGHIAFAARREGKVANDDRVDWGDAFALFPGPVLYVWHASLYGSQVQDAIERSGFDLRSQIIWAKSRFAISRGHYHWQHECCFYGVRRGSQGHWRGDRSQTTLWTVEESVEADENNHGTPKPVALMRRPILNHTDAGETVYDPFVGSGTTIIAAETTGRTCDAMEIEPTYVDVAIRRWQAFTGQTAVLETDGRDLAAIARERSPS